MMLALALALSGALRTSRAVAVLGGNGPDATQTDDSLPVGSVTLIGSSPAEAPAETWGVGEQDGTALLVHYTPATGWTLAAPFLDAGGQPLSGFQLDVPESYRVTTPSPLAGQMTPAGAGVLAGSVGSQSSAQQALLVRDPGGAFKETAPVPSSGEGALLKEGEQLLARNQPPLLAAVDESDGRAGALVVPVNEAEGIDSGVLHWNGETWTREKIEIPPKSSERFEVIAIGASSPENAWLLARLSPEYPTGSVALFRRQAGSVGEAPKWMPVSPRPGGEAGEPLAVEGNEQFTVPTGDQAQILTVTSQGLWIDGMRRDVQAPTTFFFSPEGASPSGHIQAVWCQLPTSAPEGTRECQHTLPDALPTGPSRSFAWASGGPVGSRVITGLKDGVGLRLQGEAFEQVLSLGGNAGASFGAAFSTPFEGWLGKELLPVHLTEAPAANRLTPWPVAFRDALVALAPQPQAAVGAISSEALAVGDRGEVARYVPGQGWLPEPLLGPGGRQTPRLRAVAWPTQSRAYAVGDLGQMWLWRGETGLWEPDPAEPENFRGNLLGIAFDPSEPARGYAVGQSGVLLSYGKTWTQEPEAALPPAARGANFTSIAFAGSEAIVAYRKLIAPGQNSYTGGIIVNEGSGWQAAPGAAEALGEGVPWAVAGLPDGGAAFTSQGGAGGAQIFERQSPGAPWQAVSYPGGFAPGSLALFREGGALRVIGSGAEPFTFSAEDEPSPPPGAPPTLVKPYPLTSDPERGVLRQTATGWSDEEHDLNDAAEVPGEYTYYDTPYEPDPVGAVMVDPTGAQGWAVGGLVDSEDALLDTADVYRYPADGTPPAGVGSTPVVAEAGKVTLAVGGGAGCAAPCATRAETQIGPDVWLASAIRQAGQIAGVRAFLYTGPRVTTGQTAGPPTIPVPYREEEQRYAAVLAGSHEPVYAVASPTDLDGEHSEGDFEEAFSGFGWGAPGGCLGLQGCEGAYYSFDSSGVRVVMLDNSTDVDSTQLEWLEAQLRSAKSAGEPVIAIGNANLSAQTLAGDGAAREVARVLVTGPVPGKDGASAYLFDSPEQNVALPLRSGAAFIPSFGSGTLGYVNHLAEEAPGGFIGASGFLLAQVAVSQRNRETNVAPVTTKLIPDVGELAMEAEQGTLLHRSEVASFEGLARRPRSGNRAHNRAIRPAAPETSPYIQIPSICVGSQCAEGIFPEYEFTSSNEAVGGFVQRNTASSQANAVLQNTKGEPIPEPHSKSGLFCAYNPGTTDVTLIAGGHSFSLPITVQAGSVRQPCGTVPAHKALASQNTATPTPTQAPATQGPAPSSSPLPVLPPPPVVPAAVAPPTPRPTPAPPFFVQPAPAAFVPGFVPVPVPTPARPTPPSGTSAVTSPVEAPQREDEEEAAPESVSNEAVAYRAPEHEPSPAYLLGVVLLAAFAGASLRGRSGRRGREIRVAPATISAMRAEQRLSRRSRRLR